MCAGDKASLTWLLWHVHLLHMHPLVPHPNDCPEGLATNPLTSKHMFSPSLSQSSHSTS
jgi:hypothetical protein